MLIRALVNIHGRSIDVVIEINLMSEKPFTHMVFLIYAVILNLLAVLIVSIYEIESIGSYILELMVQSNGIVMYLIIQQDMFINVVINDLCH